MEVRVKDLAFAYGKRSVLDIGQLTFPSGSTTALVGPNGAGKSTLLRLLAGLDRPVRGQVSFDGRAAEAGLAMRRHVAFAFQQAVFVTGTVRENLELALRLRGVPKSEWAQRVDDAAATFGIAPLLSRSAGRLSGGEAQRANLARALALRAPLTLLDEPLSGFDSPTRRALLHDLPGMLRRFETTLVVVTHDRDEALRLAGRLVVLIDGRVRAEGARADVFGAPPDPEVAAFLGYTVVPFQGEVAAIAPRALRLGLGAVTFDFLVDEVLDFGARSEAWGRIHGVHASVALPPGAGRAGATIQVSAQEGDVHRFSGPLAGGRTSVDTPQPSA